ncbi:hypothetical protein L0F63_003388 [Massospora cicadina]|nr:hypothetical protein L0F63_003388 [Massospora cicadina]
MDGSSDERTTAVQLLRRATHTRLKKSTPIQRAALRRSRSFNAYPGFIPDPEIQERLRKQNASIGEGPPAAADPAVAVEPPVVGPVKAAPDKGGLPRVTFRKSGLPTKKSMAQRRSRAVHNKPNYRSVKSGGPGRREPNQPVIAPDPLGYLASQFDANDEKPATPNNPGNPPNNPKDRRQLCRSRSFNEVQLGRVDRLERSTPSPTPRARQLGGPPGTNLHRSKSHRQVPKLSSDVALSSQALESVPLEGVPTLSASPKTGLRRWLSVGRRDKLPVSEPQAPKAKQKLGRMRSLKWVGKKFLPEAPNEAAGEGSKNLLRSKSTLESPQTPPPLKLSRSQTERRGQGEIMRSFRQLLDIFSPKNKPGTPLEIQVGDAGARKTVVENPELSLKELEIHSMVISPPLQRSPPAGSLGQAEARAPTPNIADTDQDYFSIPPRSARRPAAPQSGGEQRLSILEDRSFSAPPLKVQVEYMAPPFPVAAQLHYTPLTSPVSAIPQRHALVHRGAVKQILDSATVKDRTLLLLDHILIVAKATSANSQLAIKKVIWVDAITEVATRHKAGETTPVLPALPRKYPPVIMAAIRRFEIEPASAIGYLVGRGVLKPDPASLARLLHNTPELDRGMLGRLLSSGRSSDLLDAFLARFDWAGLRLDLALRLLLRSLKLPTSGEGAQLLLSRFAQAWHQANPHPASTYLPLSDALRVVMALLKLSRSSEASLESFLACGEPELAPALEEMYASVVECPLVEGCGTLPVGLGGRQAARSIAGETSDPMWVRISAPDPGLQVLLYSAGLTCQPSQLDFSHSDTQRFTVTGTRVGRHSLMFIFMGPSAVRYEFVPPKAYVVEPPFMKYTLSLSFTSPGPGDPAFHEDVVLASQSPLPSRRVGPSKASHPAPTKKYLFGFGNQSELTKWMVTLERTIDLYQEAQDDQAAQLEGEAKREAPTDPTAWMRRAEEATRLRHHAYARAAIHHFQPLVGQPMAPERLVALASARHYP